MDSKPENESVFFVAENFSVCRYRLDRCGLAGFWDFHEIFKVILNLVFMNWPLHGSAFLPRRAPK